MHFAIINESNDALITIGILDAIAAAVERQLYENYAPFWEAAGAHVQTYAKLEDVPASASLVVVLDSASIAGVLGYHDVTPDGRSYARVFWVPIKKNGGSLFESANSLSVTISHEILEMHADPYASLWGANPATGLFHAVEICDACQDESYTIDEIHVSNFVGPRYFRTGLGPYDWKSQANGSGTIRAPFEMSVGGYQIVCKDLGNISQIFGQEFPEWKKDTKKHPAARTVKRM